MKGQSMAALSSDTSCSTDFPVLDRVEAVTREDLLRLELDLGTQAILEAVDQAVPAVKVRHRGRTILAQPLDTRRFVLAMSRHLCFN